MFSTPFPGIVEILFTIENGKMVIDKQQSLTPIYTYGLHSGCTYDWFRMRPWFASLSMLGVSIEGLLKPTSFHPSD